MVAVLLDVAVAVAVLCVDVTELVELLVPVELDVMEDVVVDIDSDVKDDVAVEGEVAVEGVDRVEVVPVVAVVVLHNISKFGSLLYTLYLRCQRRSRFTLYAVAGKDFSAHR